MHKGWIFGPALVALALAGCVRKHGHEDEVSGLAGSQIKGIYAFAACKPTDAQIKGRITVVIPDTLDGTVIKRAVKQSLKGGEDDPAIPADDNAPGAVEPFDVFMTAANFGDQGYALVRVVIRNEARWQFYETGQFHGVGANDPNDDVLCGVKKIGHNDGAGAGQGKLIAKFYVDLAKLKAKRAGFAAPFTIGLVAAPAEEAGKLATDPGATPIFIDPKVRNDGGGVRPLGGNGHNN